MIPGFITAPPVLTAVPQFDKVVWYLKGGQPDQGTLFTDWSRRSQGVLRAGTTEVFDASKQHFSRSTISLPGVSSMLYTASAAANSPGSGDFQIAGWQRPSSISGSQCMFENRGASDEGCAVYSSVSGDARLSYANNAAVLANSGATTMSSTSTWYHWRVARVSGTVYGYINEVQVFSVADSRTFGSSLIARAGANNGPGQRYAGNMDELIYWVGYGSSAAGAVPTVPFGDF
jgi:hypothetical protein